jgi:hypothetical protein
MDKFWWSGETQADVGDLYSQAMNVIEAELNRLLADVSFGGPAEQWAFIAIIRKEDSSLYDEVVKKSSRGKVLEFRLKIPHAEFLAASPSQRIRLIFHTLLRSVDHMRDIGVSGDTQNTLRAILSRAEKETASTSFVN